MIFGFTPLGRSVSADELTLIELAKWILVTNDDIIEWALCLVNAWCDDLVDTDWDDCVMDLVRGNDTLFAVVEDMDGDGAGAYTVVEPAPDGSLGVLVPIGDPIFTSLVSTISNGSPQEVFCAAVAAATYFLHEMVHSCGDVNRNYLANPDAHHADWPPRGIPEEEWPPPPCCDEARMVDSIFQWAMGQRFPCLDAQPCCEELATSSEFGYSGITAPWSGDCY